MARTVKVSLMADVSGFTSGLSRAGKATRDFTGQLDKAASAGKLDHLTNAAAGLGVGFLGAAGAVVKFSADFDKQMSSVRAATHANVEDMGLLRKAALDAGAETKYSATEAAKGIEELSKAGVTTSEILGGGLRGALSLASAGELDVGQAAEFAASAMTQFNLKGKDVPHIADLLAAGAGKAQGSVQDMGAALSQSGLVAKQMGLTVEDTTGTLAAFASAGLMGSDAGTSLKTSLLMLANPTAKSKELMKDLGIQTYDASGKFVGITALAGQLQTRLGGLTQEQRNAALATIFGSDAIRAASVLYDQGAKGIQTWIGKVNVQGYAAETARIKTDNLAGDIERLTGSLETMAIQAGSGANGGLRILVQGLNSLVDKFAALPPVVGSTLTVMAGVGGALLLAGAGWAKYRSVVADVTAELRNTGPAGAKAATALERVGSVAGKVAIAFAALQIANAAVAASQEDLNPQVEALGVGLVKWSRGSALAGEASRLLGADMDILKSKFRFLADEDNSRSMAVKNLQGALEGLVPGLQGASGSLDNTRKRVVAMDQALAGLVQGGATGDAKAAFDKITQALAVNGVTVEEVRKQFPQYAAALEVTAGASKGATAATNKNAGAMDAAAKAAKGEREALSDLSKEMKAQSDPVFGLLNAEDKLRAAQDKATEAIKKHGRSSKEAKAATRDLAEAAIDLQGHVGALGGSFNGKLTPQMYATLRAAGLTENQIKDVAKQFRQAKSDADKYDGEYKARTSAPGATTSDKQLKDAKKSADLYDGKYNAWTYTPNSPAANREIKLLWDRLKGVDGNWTARLHTTGYGGVASNLRHLLAAQRALKENTSVNEANRELSHFFAASGGPVYGPGTATSDSIPAYLSAGEHVWTAAEVAALGGQSAMLALRGAVRSGKRVEVGDETPGFAGGGYINMPFPTDVKKTKIPQMDFGGPSGGGQTYKWIEAVVRAAFPGMRVISDLRPGARTLSGNRSYHAVGRAVDYPASKPLAEWINLHYKGRTKELITPWNSLNIHNGRRHTYTGAIYRQHNFAGGNAHDHWAMANGGTIREPVFGVGRSGDTYSFGEGGRPETVVPGAAQVGTGGAGPVTNVSVIVQSPVGSSPKEIGRAVSDVLDSYCRSGGRVALRGTVHA